MIIRYEESYKEQWDFFVLEKSMNGNFLQTRNFLNYHKAGKFVDHSLIFLKGETIAAVMPANELMSEQEIVSHQGSTFGGIVIGEQFASICNYEWIFDELVEYLKDCQFKRIVIRMPNWLYCRKDKHMELLDYYFGLRGFSQQAEVGFFLNLSTLPNNFEETFSTLKRRKLRKALSNHLEFRRLESDEEVSAFYDVLADNMKKFHTKPLHSLEEMLEFKKVRLKNLVSFYGVFHQNSMIAGSMVFDFNDKKVFHTQYLASRHDYLELCPNEFLYVNLIKEALEHNYRYLSYGTTTLEHGKVLNRSLALFKEGFNTESYVNRTYVMNLNEVTS